jgi:hypothetical protein
LHDFGPSSRLRYQCNVNQTVIDLVESASFLLDPDLGMICELMKDIFLQPAIHTFLKSDVGCINFSKEQRTIFFFCYYSQTSLGELIFGLIFLLCFQS